MMTGAPDVPAQGTLPSGKAVARRALPLRNYLGFRAFAVPPGHRGKRTISRRQSSRKRLRAGIVWDPVTVADNGQITVFLVDDHEVVRRGVHDLLSGEPDIIVVGEAGTGEEAMALVPEARPDVADTR